MAFINLILLFLLCIAIVFYRFVFPKKKINLFILVIFISILPILSILRPGTFESGDLSFHINHSISFYDSLQEGNLVPRWGGELNATYGYPVFIFMYILPYYIISLLHSLGFSFLISIKILLIASYMLSGIFIYKWLQRDLGHLSAFTASIFYIFAPYHLMDLHFRTDIGELLALCLIPLVLMIIRIVSEKKDDIFLLILNAFVFASLILSHPALSISAVPLFLFYIIHISKNKAKTLKLVFSFVLGIFLSAFYWAPTVLSLGYTHQPMFSKFLKFVEIKDLLYSPYKFGFLFQGPKGELIFLIGYIHILVIIAAMYYLYLKKVTVKEKRKELFFFTSVFFVSVLLMLPISKPIWEFVPFVNNFQFTYRLLGISILASSVVAGILTKKLNKRIYILFLGITILSSILNWSNRKNIPALEEKTIRENLPLSTTTSAASQAITKWSDPKKPWIDKVPNSPLFIFNHNMEYKMIVRKSTEHVYEIKAKENSFIRDNTLYFPGWKAFIDSKNVPIVPDKKGIISLKVPKGNYKLTIKYEEPLSYKLSEAISILALAMCVLIVCFYKIKNYFFQR